MIKKLKRKGKKITNASNLWFNLCVLLFTTRWQQVTTVTQMQMLTTRLNWCMKSVSVLYPHCCSPLLSSLTGCINMGSVPLWLASCVLDITPWGHIQFHTSRNLALVWVPLMCQWCWAVRAALWPKWSGLRYASSSFRSQCLPTCCGATGHIWILCPATISSFAFRLTSLVMSVSTNSFD